MNAGKKATTNATTVRAEVVEQQIEEISPVKEEDGAQEMI